MLLLPLAPLLPLVPGANGGEKFACNMNALTKADRARHQELTKSLLASVKEQKELADGYGFRFPAESLTTVAEWVSLERLCCPFFTFELEQARDGGPLWLRVKGSPGVKDFIKMEFGL